MYKRPLAFLILALAFVGTASAAHPATPFRRIALPLPASVDKLVGEDARRYVNNLRVRHPGLFEKAAVDLLRRGYHDTGEFTVLRSVRLARQMDRRTDRSPYFLTDTVTGSEGEIIYWAWDDGDYYTWEGNVYIHEYSNDNWISANCQTSVDEGTEWYLIWDYMVDAGGPDIERGPQQIRMWWRPEADYSHAVDHPGQLRVTSPFILAGINWDYVRRKWEDWSWCAAFGCAGSAAQCYGLIRGTRERAECAAFTCIGVGIGCLYVLK